MTTAPEGSARPRAARVSLARDFTVGPVPPRLFGSFVEHMGRCVYTGVYEPDHPTADEQGLRGDVLELTREVAPTVVRYPGGNFVSGYDWQDGVGPREQRPRRLDRAWRSIETNQFGTAEFVRWAGAVGAEPMMAVNLGTRGVQEACDLLEYTNHPGGSRFSDLRRAHGDADPYGIRLWCLGNEMDGPWQVGHKTAREYGRLAAETARAMRLVDPDVELVACGSSGRGMPTFGEWERTVLEECYDLVDHVSAHAYYEEHDRPGGTADFLACAADLDAFIEEVVATADAVRARGRHRRRLTISFDEWNVWYLTRHEAGDLAQQRTPWQEAPRVIEDEYSLTDAVVVGTMLHSLLRHADRVAIGCQAQLVNVIGLLRSEPAGPAWKQTTALPFQRLRHHAVGEVLLARTSGDRHESPTYGDVPVVDAVATWDGTGGTLSLFLANRDLAQPATLTVDLHGFPELRPLDAVVLDAADGDRHATNDLAHPDRVALRPLTEVRTTPAERGSATATVVLPPLSWAHVRLAGPPRG